MSDATAPAGLPGSVYGKEEEAAPRRVCPDCGAEPRMVSNNLGRRAYCGPCKKSWAVSLPEPSAYSPELPGRGLTKQTTVPQYTSESMADAPATRSSDDKIGPKNLRRR